MSNIFVCLIKKRLKIIGHANAAAGQVLELNNNLSLERYPATTS